MFCAQNHCLLSVRKHEAMICQSEQHSSYKNVVIDLNVPKRTHRNLLSSRGITHLYCPLLQPLFFRQIVQIYIMFLYVLIVHLENIWRK